MQTETGIEFPLVEADAAETGLPSESADLVVSEYGASIWVDPYRWIPEAARLLRPGGRLVFLRNSTLVILCSPDEVPASEILAITFTRKAAREMRARLDDWLRFMATAEDGAVRAFLAERAVPPEAIEALLPRARGLFEAVLSAQPGITISTFHAWFLTVIERAPLEAGLAGFTLAEQTHELEAEAWEALADDLARAPAAPLAVAMQSLLADIGLYNTRALLTAFLARRGEWWAFTEWAARPRRLRRGATGSGTAGRARRRCGGRSAG